MDTIRWIRFAIYCAAALVSFAFGLRLVSLPNKTAVFFGVATFANALNAGLFAVLLAYIVIAGTAPPWRDAVNTFNAVVQLGAPVALVWLFNQKEGDNGR